MNPYIYRDLLRNLNHYFDSDRRKGLILSGIVGCGKTTLVEHFLDEVSGRYKVFRFSGDETVFRRSVAENSNFILEQVRMKTKGRALVFVDEVQKSEEVFDALKIAFDQGQVSFIVSGSNPAFLSSVAKRRLQRRADQIFMLPISLLELTIHKGLADEEAIACFADLLWKWNATTDCQLPETKIPADLNTLLKDFFVFGGLPLALLSETSAEKLREIKLTVERGFELFSSDNNALADAVRIELAHLHSKEFTYKNILEKTRTRKRDGINAIIDDLINHGYLVRKKPYLMYPRKSSYLVTYSYVDPGLVSYLTSDLDPSRNLGFQIEGYVHARLMHLVTNSPLKAELFYFKNQTLDSNENIRFLPGELDFVLSIGRRIIPIEVKMTADASAIDTTLIKDFVRKNKSPYGILLYAGPACRRDDNLIFWPYWLV